MTNKSLYCNNTIHNMNTRLGYACINKTLTDNKKICCNKTCRLATAINKGIESGYPKGSKEYSNAIYNFLTEYSYNNLIAMYKIISWSRKHGIMFYRMSSNMFPHISNSKIQVHLTSEDWIKYNSLDFGKEIIEQIGAYSQKYGIRLTMHPGHYNQLGSKTSSVVKNTFVDLTWQGRLLELMSIAADGYNLYLKQNNRPVKENIFNHGTLCVHGGGTYGDKTTTLTRWKANYNKLPDFVRKRIAVENDEKSYSAEDLLPLCQELNIPMIFDFHHYNCWTYYHETNPHQRPLSELVPEILKTWERRKMTPKFHLSDQAKDKKIGAHHDYVESIPDELLLLMKSGYKFDIMIEAKMKELATLKLYRKYDKFFK